MFKRLFAALFALIAATAFAAVDVNKASSAELDGIKGIGPAIATKILDERKKGNFKDWNDLVERVKGIGEGSAAKLSSAGLTVDGASFKGAAPAAKTDAKAAAADKPAKAEKPAKADKAKTDDKAAAADKPADAKAAKPEAKTDDKAAKKAEKAEKAAAKKAEKAAAKADAASAAKK